mmetsp:Transcript_23237/g.68692  ORF Transcript_23237/g.68692 Transcript_23237/m.68692 type:complete len:356 (-) Transcript_23237:481-1548(-)
MVVGVGPLELSYSHNMFVPPHLLFFDAVGIVAAGFDARDLLLGVHCLQYRRNGLQFLPLPLEGGLYASLFDCVLDRLSHFHVVFYQIPQLLLPHLCRLLRLLLHLGQGDRHGLPVGRQRFDAGGQGNDVTSEVVGLLQEHIVRFVNFREFGFELVGLLLCHLLGGLARGNSLLPLRLGFGDLLVLLGDKVCAFGLVLGDDLEALVILLGYFFLAHLDIGLVGRLLLLELGDFPPGSRQFLAGRFELSDELGDGRLVPQVGGRGLGTAGDRRATLLPGGRGQRCRGGHRCRRRGGSGGRGPCGRRGRFRGRYSGGRFRGRLTGGGWRRGLVPFLDGFFVVSRVLLGDAGVGTSLLG